MNTFKDSSEPAIGTQAVPSLLQLSVAVISNFKLWASTQDIPEPTVPFLLKSIMNTDFKLDHLPNLLPAPLQHLNLTGHHSMTEECLLSIIKKCFLLRTLILKDMPLLDDNTVSKILWHLPNLHRLSMGAGVGSLSILEIHQRPNILTHLEIHSAGLDDMWLEHLRYFPNLTTLKLRNAAVPRVQSVAFKLPPNLSFVDIMTSGQTGDNNVNLLNFFLTEAPNLVQLTLGGYSLTTKEVGPIVAKNLRVLRGWSMKVSQAVVDAISDTCQQLEEVSGFSLIISDRESRRLGVVSVPAGQSPVSFTYTNKKLNHDYSGITSETAWAEGPTKFNAPHGSSYVLPIDPCLSLRRLELDGGTVDIVEMLQLFPNLEGLALRSVKLKLEKSHPRGTNSFGSKLKWLNIQCDEVPAGAIDWLAKSTSLKSVNLTIDQIPEFNSQPISLDSVLRRFPYMKYLTVSTSSMSVTITNAESCSAAISNHPLKGLWLNGYSDRRNAHLIKMQLEKLDFNHYKQLQTLHFSNLRTGSHVTLHNRLRWLNVNSLHEHSESFNIPETLFHLRWECAGRYSDLVVQALPKLKSLCSVQLDYYTKLRAAGVLKDSAKQQYSSLRYLIPPRQEETPKTNYLSVFTGFKDEALLVSTLKAMLGSSGSNLSIEELQLIAEMYSKHEISLRSEELTVNVKIRLASGTILNIICNPSHRVLDLYAYARHAVKHDNKAFDLVTPLRKVLDISTYDKTVQELDLAYMTLIQSLRDYTPVEKEMRNFGIAHIKLREVGKNKNAGVVNDGCYSIQPSSAVTVNNNDNDSQDDDVSMSESSVNDDSANENSSDCSEYDDSEADDDEYYGMQVSDDEEDWMSMFPEPKKEVDPNKYLLDQMNASMLRKSIEYHEQKQREEREAARLRHEAELKKKQQEEKAQEKLLKIFGWQSPVDTATAGTNSGPIMNQNFNRINYGPRVNHFQGFNNQNIGQPAVLNEVATDEELALAMQQEEFLEDDFDRIPLF